jgi:hypothetical protein
MNTSNHAARHVQAQVPPELHRRLRDLSYDTERSVGDLMVDATLLLLRFHGRGGGLPEPVPPAEEHHAESANATDNNNED